MAVVEDAARDLLWLETAIHVEGVR